MDEVNFGRFRAYGEIRKGRERIVLVTEFKELTENAALWEEVNALVKKTKAHSWIMDEMSNNDHSWQTDKTGKKIKGSDQYGANYDKRERQVELSWRIEKLTPSQLTTLVDKLHKATEGVWKKAGVGVC